MGLRLDYFVRLDYSVISQMAGSLVCSVYTAYCTVLCKLVIYGRGCVVVFISVYGFVVVARSTKTVEEQLMASLLRNKISSDVRPVVNAADAVPVDLHLMLTQIVEMVSFTSSQLQCRKY